MTIEISKPEVVQYKDFEMPEIVYKYRDWNDSRHKRLISDREVFFASPEKFADEFDCKNPTRWDLLTDEEIINRYYQDSLKKNPSFTIEKHMEFAIYWANNSLVKDKNFIKEQNKKTFDQFNDRHGILSLTEYPAEYKMWEKYGSSHTGFCVGFDARTMLEGIGTGGGIVLYFDELPTIHPSPKHNFMEQSALQIFSKLQHWSFEKEYRAYIFRTHSLTINDRTVVVPPEAFKEIILGAQISEKNAKEIIASVPKVLRHIRIKKAYLQNDGITIQDY